MKVIPTTLFSARNKDKNGEMSFSGEYVKSYHSKNLMSSV